MAVHCFGSPRPARDGAKFLALIALTAATACSSGSTPAPTQSPSAKPATTITVTMKEYSLALSPAQAAAGTVTFVVDNAGAVAHALAVAGPGVSDAHTSTVPPGGRARLTVPLKAGSYELWCPIGKHRELGMDTHLQVGGKGPASPAPGSATATATATGQ
ncbi:cupredoxin domain-containing protein [Streptomyces sp. NPDC048506]|uniref:cupredoxin domain-containing protein n=1 Tax=Streptomyces sp. NPDC048506 TaxID=3155028 RepID=UPI0034461EAC